LLADEIGVHVPPTRLGTCNGTTMAVSTLWGERSYDIPKFAGDAPNEYASEQFRAALRHASGLVPFQTWVNNSDHKDQHVMVRPGASPGTYEIASIDFAGAFVWDASGGQLNLVGPPVLIMEQNRDLQRMSDTIAKIESLTDGRIREIVQQVPDDVLSAAEKDRYVAGLIARRGKLRAEFVKAGWLPGGA
jgi:hypothetical protein